jgi:Pilin (bacterial filament)
VKKLLLSLLFASPMLSAQSRLIDTLPEGTATYVRIPALLNQFDGSKSGRTLDAAFNHPANKKALAQLREGISQLKDLPEQGDTLIKFLLTEQSAPLELVVLAPSTVVNPLSPVLLQTTLRTRDKKEFQSQWSALGNELQQEAIVHQFDAKTGQLRVLLGAGVQADQLKKMPIMKGAPAELLAAQTRLDASGEGFFIWMDGQALAPMLSLGFQDEGSKEVLKALQVLDGLALGAGSVGGRGRMGMDVYFDQTQAAPDFMTLLPKANRKFDFKTVGEPKLLFQMSIPNTPEEIDNIIRLLPKPEAEDSKSEVAQRAIDNDESEVAQRAIDNDESEVAPPEEDLRTILNKKVLGEFTVKSILALLGPELAYFSDEAGYFSAMRIQDKKAFRSFISSLPETARYAERGGIHELHMGALDFAPELAFADPNTAALLRLNRGSYFWIEEGDWLILAQVPQLLRDRMAMKARYSQANWQKAVTGNAANERVLSVIAKTEDMPMYSYYAYLSLLQALANVADINLDLRSLPSARELKLKKDSQVGISMDASPHRLSLSLHYDATPVDALAGSGSSVAAIATVSVLAAIALPAYQDYVARAKVATAIAEVQSAKVELAEIYLSDGVMPQEKVFESSDDYTISLEEGLLMLRFSDVHETTALRGKTLAFAPVHERGEGIGFVCGFAQSEAKLFGPSAQEQTTLEAKYLPADCR